MALGAALFSATALAQLALPAPGLPRVNLPSPISLPEIDKLTQDQLGRVLEQARLDRISRFVRLNRAEVDVDEDRHPAVRGQLVVSGASEASIVEAQQQGFRPLSSDRIDGLDLSYVRFATPAKMSLREAEKALQQILPDADVDVDHIYFQSGATTLPAITNIAAARCLV